MRKIAMAAAVLAATSTFAFAADMPIKAKGPVPVPMYNWSGFYFGGDLGWQSSSIGLSAATLAGVALPLTYSPRHSSVAFGGFLGYQWQFSQWVLGIEGGYTAASGSADLGAVPSISIFLPGGTGTASAKLKDIWNIGARAGWAMGPQGTWLPYLTGGWASGRFQFDAASAGLTETASATTNGGYLGGGVDWAVMPNTAWGGSIILGLEYRHYWWSSKTATSTINGVAGELITFSPKTDTIVGRLSWKFP